MRPWGLLILTLAILLAGAAPATGAPRHRIRVAHDLDLSAFESEDEKPGHVRIAYGPEGGLVVVYVVEDSREDVALVWRRVGPDGAVSPATRIPLPDLAQRIAKIPSVVVGRDGETTIALRTLYRESWEVFGPFSEAPTELVRVGPDGSVTARLSLGAPAERVLLAAHGDRVHVAFDAELTHAGDRAVYWRRIGPDGEFTGEPVRLSAFRHGDEPNRISGIWDVFLGVAADGTARIVYRRMEALLYTDHYTIVVGPEVFWTSVSDDSVASTPVSLGSVPDGVGSFNVAVAPDGTVCVVCYQAHDELGIGTSYPAPLLVSPEGTVRIPEDRVMPRLLTYYPGEQYALGADVSSTFRITVFATDAYRSRPGDDRHVPRSLVLTSLGARGEAGQSRRIRLRFKPEYVWAHLVAEDGTRMIAGDREVYPYHRNPRKRRDVVTVLFADRKGRPIRRKSFRNPIRIHPHQPVLASTTAGGLDRFAAAWSGWGSPEHPDSRYVRVVIFTRETRR